MNSIDVEYIWQRRIQHGFRYQRGKVPFPDLDKIGLDFNVASKRKEKVDLKLLTNGVVLDICDFAKAVTKAGRYFVFEILEFNFDLGTYNDQERDLFASRIFIKAAQERLKMRPQKLKEIFVLPERKLLTDVCLTKIPEKSQCFPSCSNGEVQIDSSEALNGEVKITQVESGGGRPKLKKELYPLCKKIGLDLDIRPKDTAKQKLHLNLLTKSVIMELLRFGKVLCGTQTCIVYDVLEHNFELSVGKIHARQQILQLLTERRTCGFPPHLRAAFRQEPFIFHERKSGTKWKRRWPVEADDHALTTVAEETIKRKRKIKPRDNLAFSSIGHIFYSQSSHSALEHSELSYNELFYLCPVETEKEMLSNSEDGQEKMRMETRGVLETAESSELMDVKEEEVEIAISPSKSWSDGSWGQPHAPGLFRGTSKAISGQISDDVSRVVKVETAKLMLWRRRAVRSKQILVNGNFDHCKMLGLNFNVGFGVKRNINLKRLTNGILYEVSQFARAMTRTRGSFLFEFLNNHFYLNIQHEHHRRNFLFYINTKVKSFLDNNCRSMEFLNDVIELPEIYNMIDVTCDFDLPQEDLTEKQPGCEPPLVLKNDQQASMEAYPFCKKMGLNLWSMDELPMNKKLDLSCLTNGALLEVVNFTKELCGDIWEIIFDILEHNFDLNLPGGKTKVLQYIRRWYSIQKCLKGKRSYSTAIEASANWLKKGVQLKSYLNAASVCAQSHPPGPIGNGLKDIANESHNDTDFEGVTLITAEQQMPRTECGSYPLCKEIGLQLEISSRSEVKAKLDPQLLTRAIVYEMHKFVNKNRDVNYVHALYRILEHNFDLSSQNHRRWEFALSVASQVNAMAGKFKRHLSKKGDYPNKVFELPFEVTVSGQNVCKEEPEDAFGGLNPGDNDDVLFVRQLIPVDIEVELE